MSDCETKLNQGIALLTAGGLVISKADRLNERVFGRLEGCRLPRRKTNGNVLRGFGNVKPCSGK